jgi:hypothetical protein
MADDELTPEEVTALAGTFDVAAAKTLLRAARFPLGAIPETGYRNSREFWSEISRQLGDGVMEDGRRKIIKAAWYVYPFSRTLPKVPDADASSGTMASGGRGIEVAGGQGIVVGDNNVQYNFHVMPEFASAAVRQTVALRVLVIGASPIDEDLPHVRADREAHAIEKVALPDRIAVKVILGAEATDVRQVGAFRPDIVHFVCHGTADSLVFNDARGESDFVTAQRVAETLGFYRDTAGIRLRCVVLAACDGHALAPYFTGVADLVIAHRGKLSDPCGVAFAEQFYTLVNGTPAADLAAVAHEAAHLTAQYSAFCEPVVTNLITATGRLT